MTVCSSAHSSSGCNANPLGLNAFVSCSRLPRRYVARHARTLAYRGDVLGPFMVKTVARHLGSPCPLPALVRIALRRPYTFVVLALLLLILGPLAAWRTPVDIFPEIRIPVIAVIWQYTGLPPEEMAGRMVTQFQRTLTTTVNDIEHIEATNYTGIGIVKIFLHPGGDVRTATPRVTSVSQTLLKQMPPGSTPPLILLYNASTVPIIQLALSGKGLPEQALFDLGLNFVRVPVVTVPGAAMPYPFGGKFRQVQIDVNPEAMRARGLSAQDVAVAFAQQNLITPVGTEKIGTFEYAINLNDAVPIV